MASRVFLTVIVFGIFAALGYLIMTHRLSGLAWRPRLGSNVKPDGSERLVPTEGRLGLTAQFPGFSPESALTFHF